MIGIVVVGMLEWALGIGHRRLNGSMYFFYIFLDISDTKNRFVSNFVNTSIQLNELYAVFQHPTCGKHLNGISYCV